MPHIPRRRFLIELNRRIKRSRVVGIIGLRQSGKTTLARDFCRQHGGTVHHFDLERAPDRARLEDPFLALEPLRGLVVIDEIQHQPDIFTTLRVLADRPRTPARFIILGSASPEILRQTAESLAGRISYMQISGFHLDEMDTPSLQKLWVRGGLPPAFLARSYADSSGWRDDFIDTFLQRDVPQLGISTPATMLRRLWTMIAHYHGQTWNASEFGRAFGVSYSTIGRYLDQLTSVFAVTQLQPWFENLKKRQVKAPKIYLSDSGVLHSLLGIVTPEDLDAHPKRGASWEGFVIQELIAKLAPKSSECFFWRTHAGAELDLLILKGRKRYGFECKLTSAPRITPSMRSAISDLRLSRLDVIYAGSETYALSSKVRAVPASRIWQDI